ncbi:hypothetical protein NDU88_001148 [Pleurodeles waltl]|uniref:Uncharacterized protein n=1 Tax=Pleurodeles waltl TaxID=8319 RepID=A0AAV7N9Y8_PLEWA|nr:hypothetical protein NDU88_001148 [Pleurodeles waltl]
MVRWISSTAGFQFLVSESAYVVAWAHSQCSHDLEPIFLEVFSPLALLLKDTDGSWRTHCLQHRGYQKESPLLGPRPNIQVQDPRHSFCGLQVKAARKS